MQFMDSGLFTFSRISYYDQTYWRWINSKYFVLFGKKWPQIEEINAILLNSKPFEFLGNLKYLFYFNRHQELTFLTLSETFQRFQFKRPQLNPHLG